MFFLHVYDQRDRLSSRHVPSCCSIWPQFEFVCKRDVRPACACKQGGPRGRCSKNSTWRPRLPLICCVLLRRNTATVARECQTECKGRAPVMQKAPTQNKWVTTDVHTALAQCHATYFRFCDRRAWWSFCVQSQLFRHFAKWIVDVTGDCWSPVKHNSIKSV